MESDRITELDVAESILNAVAIYKKIRSTSVYRQRRAEYLYVIEAQISTVSRFTQKDNWLASQY